MEGCRPSDGVREGGAVRNTGYSDAEGVTPMNSNPAARLAIAAYRPKAGKEAALMALAQEHVAYLRSIGAATSREHILATAADGTLIEVFEWAEGGLQMAHAHSGLMEMWKRYAEACDYVPLASLVEAQQMFASFVAVN
jgi:hypothetical protein